MTEARYPCPECGYVWNNQRSAEECEIACKGERISERAYEWRKYQ